MRRLSRLRAEDGSVIMPAQYIKVAAPAGLMSVVDNLLLFRCVQVVRRLTHKEPRRSASSATSPADTLADTEFFPQFLDYMQANAISPARSCSNSTREAVLQAGVAGRIAICASLSEHGLCAFRWTMSRRWRWISCKLKALGFRHLKVRADILTQGMNGAGAAVAAEDFKKLLVAPWPQSDRRAGGRRKDRGAAPGLQRGLCPGLPVRRAARGARGRAGSPRPPRTPRRWCSSARARLTHPSRSLVQIRGRCPHPRLITGLVRNRTRP